MSFVKEGQQDHYKKKTLMKNDESWVGAWEIAADLPACALLSNTNQEEARYGRLEP